MGMLRNMLKDPEINLITFAPEFNIYERFVVHIVAEMLDLEHQSFDMEDGKCFALLCAACALCGHRVCALRSLCVVCARARL